MRAPAFWWRPPALEAALLGPLASLYGAAAARRMERPGRRADRPVICVGNFTLGGAGKTPMALAVAEILAERGLRPAFLSRGYGGRLAGPVRVDADRHRAADIGDEPLLLARAAPTVVARDRPAGARLCIALGADAVVMDDGLQNPSLVKDLALAVVDGETGIGNGRVFPAGPLRAPLAAQWRRLHALVIVGEGRAGAALGEEARRRGLPVLAARLAPDPVVAEKLRRRRVLAFAGIGRPEKFFRTLEALGAEVVRRRAFADHHPYPERELAALSAEAEAAGLDLVTTEKDLARIGPPRPGQRAIRALPVRVAFEDPDALRRLLDGLVGAAARPGAPPA